MTRGGWSVGNSLAIRDTGKYGKGVFAAKDFKKGEIIFLLGGKKTTLKSLVNRICSGHLYLDDPLQIGRRTYVELDKVSRLFNHSCEPAAGMRKCTELFALRDIARGEEITYDYSLTVAPTDWTMRCNCNTQGCRGVIGDIGTVPRNRRNQLRQAGAVQTYMKSLLDEIDEGTYKIPQYELNALAILNQRE